VNQKTSNRIKPREINSGFLLNNLLGSPWAVFRELFGVLIHKLDSIVICADDQEGVVVECEFSA
jgi:hypothetical protein